MNITELTRNAGPHKRRKRVGRGESSGLGKTCGRGHKGAGARSGHRKVSLAEGATFPLFRRIPKFGFNNALFQIRYQIVNVEDLEKRFDAGSHVTVDALQKVGLIRDREDRVKILGKGDLTKSLSVESHRFSGSAISKIEGVGGSVKWLAPKPKKKFVKRFTEPAKIQEKKPGSGEKKSKKQKSPKKDKGKSQPE